MKKLFLSLLLLPMMAMAGNIKSPNGNIEVKFSVDNTGRPVYEMTYKGKAVIKPSHLGLELAKDKHASKGMQETDLMNGFKIAKEEINSFDETWQPVWGDLWMVSRRIPSASAAGMEVMLSFSSHSARKACGSPVLWLSHWHSVSKNVITYWSWPGIWSSSRME